MVAFFLSFLQFCGQVAVICLSCLIAHEIGHVVSIYITRAGHVTGVVVTPMGVGVCWEQVDPQPYKLLLVALAGPVANLVAAGISASLPQLAFGLINLIFLHVPGSDGYKALLYARMLFCKQKQKSERKESVG